MNTKESLDKLKSDITFKQYLKDNTNAYLSYFFMMVVNDIKQDWQVGYYNPDSNLINTYTITTKEITAEPPQEPFNKPGDIVQELDFSKVKINYTKAMEIAKACQKDNYSNALVSKTMIILQNINNVGNIWNITFITMNLDTINVRINISNGKIVSHEKQSLIQDIKEGIKK